MPTSFSCQRTPVCDHQLPIETSPRPAEREIGLGPIPRKNLVQIKNPATSAGRIRPLLEAFYAPLERMCSKLDFFLPGIRNQPHLWMSRQARSVSSLSPESGLYQLPASISKSKFPSSCIHDWKSPVTSYTPGEIEVHQSEAVRGTCRPAEGGGAGRRAPVRSRLHGRRPLFRSDS